MHLYQALIPLLGLILNREVFTALVPRQIPLQKVEVIDGDTVKVSRRGGDWIVRLKGVDAPEHRQPFADSTGDAGQEAHACLADVLKPQTQWQLEWHGLDLYGRILGELVSERGRLSELLLEAGCVSVYPFLFESSRLEKRQLWQAMHRAQRARRGLWNRGGFMRPYVWRKLQKARRAPVATE